MRAILVGWSIDLLHGKEDTQSIAFPPFRRIRVAFDEPITEAANDPHMVLSGVCDSFSSFLRCSAL